MLWGRNSWPRVYQMIPALRLPAHAGQPWYQCQASVRDLPEGHGMSVTSLLWKPKRPEVPVSTGSSAVCCNHSFWPQHNQHFFKGKIPEQSSEWQQFPRVLVFWGWRVTNKIAAHRSHCFYQVGSKTFPVCHLYVYRTTKISSKSFQACKTSCTDMAIPIVCLNKSILNLEKPLHSALSSLDEFSFIWSINVRMMWKEANWRQNQLWEGSRGKLQAYFNGKDLVLKPLNGHLGFFHLPAQTTVPCLALSWHQLLFKSFFLLQKVYNHHKRNAFRQGLCLLLLA